ncbi:hypothetical protein OPKNFCMD_3744 [Methylobacterium crusticola]|uniref:Peptidoglycan-binding protein n=2 Tax=Methylobacterium crusticola TaxID=1697972 RepID=A0ABQ4QZZ4_9HYPH|nr:hypothetical protein [Methylobacterium crusticola]GJD50993.1 hypothetical protein OPKNFCMD_3744 [Methylobacterium crusticola]
MRRNATPSLDAFDPDLREAAREAAQRAGMSVEEWLAAAVSEGTARSGGRGGRPPGHAAPRGRPPGGQPPGGGPGRAAERGWHPAGEAGHRDGDKGGRGRAGRGAEARWPAPAPTIDPSVAEAVSAMTRRLDEIDRRLSETRDAAGQAVAKAVEGIETRLSETLRSGAEPARVDTLLREFEQRIAELGERLSAPGERLSAPGRRRVRPVQEDLKAAVAEIRRRQQQLDGDAAGAADAAAESGGGSPRDPDRAAETAGAGAGALSPAIAGLQAETTRLRDSVGGLATSGDVGTLEQAVRTLTDEVQRAREPADLAAIAGPIDLMRVQVGRLADEVAANVHARVTQDVERLARQVDGALGVQRTGGLADRDAVSKLFRELDDIRGQIATLADPARIQSLAHSVNELTETVASLGASMVGNRPLMDELKPLLEEIRSGLRSPGQAGAPALAKGIADLDRKLDDMRAETAARASGDLPDASGDILGRIDALSAKVDQVTAVNPVGDVMERLEQIGESLRRPPVPGDDLASIHGMLRGLAEKLDRVGQGVGGDALDGLEKQVLALARRIDTRGSDPALAGLERTMGDLLAQVALLRDEAPLQAAVERAARSAVADTIGAGREGRAGADPAGMDVLQATLADLKAQQAACDKRLQATMEGVHGALERLVGRLSQIETERRPEEPRTQAGTLSIGPRRRDTGRGGLREALPEGAAPPERAPRRPEASRGGQASPADEMLEPGASRPRAAEAEAAAEIPAGDIKASFIAAARRAAQAAAAEAADTGASRPGPREEAAAPRRGVVDRLRATLERRRRPLLLGLAAIVLALGTLQAINGTLGGRGGPEAPPVAAAPPASREAAAPPPPADPVTTQALDAKAASPTETAEAKPPAPPEKPTAAPEKAIGAPEKEPARAAARPLPRVSDMAALGTDLAGIPASLAALRQAASEGDGAAVYELAGRAAEGRGMGRDPALAAKLFDRLAALGYAPAQYRLGSQYEKGLGVVRDQAKARLWYGRAAEQGHARAMHNLAVMMAESGGAGAKPDYAAAANWFKRAADHGVRDSQYNLAVLLARGLGIAQNLPQAYGWFSAAAAQGDDDAARKRDEVASKLSPKDLAAARAAAEAWKPASPDPAVNEPPPARAEGAAPASGALSLVGAPPPAAISRRTEAGPARGDGKV